MYCRQGMLWRWVIYVVAFKLQKQTALSSVCRDNYGASVIQPGSNRSVQIADCCSTVEARSLWIEYIIEHGWAWVETRVGIARLLSHLQFLVQQINLIFVVLCIL